MPPWIERVVQKVAPLATWEELGLTEDAQQVLRRLIEDSRSGGAKSGSGKAKARTGVTALLAGPGERRKLLAAQVLARELRTNLFRIDLSLVVSDRLEETERALKRILDSAEEARGVLFFDEADALFGRDEDGVDVDRGIGYLLKRTGRYPDLTLLAVSDPDGMDPVHRRKLRTVVAFPDPAAS